MPGAAPPSDLSPANLDATLARYGITLPRANGKTAAEAASRPKKSDFGRAQNRVADILHKTEAGGVVLNLRDGNPSSLRGQARCLGARGASAPHRRLPVQEMCQVSKRSWRTQRRALWSDLLVGAVRSGRTHQGRGPSLLR